MRICVTGATGFIGQYFCEQLSAAGNEVIGVDLVSPASGAPMNRFVQGDVRDRSAMASALEGCDCVLGLAAAHHDFGIDRETYFAVNETASQLLCDLCDERGIKRVCWFSSCAVYGSCPAPRNETSTPQPLSPYGASKLAGERVFAAWVGKGGGRSCLCIRPTITFGPRNWANMYSLIRQVASGRFVVAGAGANVKSLSYVENLVSATQFLWSRQGEGMNTFNWVEKPDLSSAQISQTVADALGKKRAGVRLPFWLVRAFALPFDLVIAVTGMNLPVSGMRVRKLFLEETRFESAKARDAGVVPTITTQEGIRRMVDWYSREGRRSQVKWRQPPRETQRF
ncbi:MAG: NAD(P)-dependent oxidoreductase [Phycisphaerales bacterium]|nr:NAD(P)-dependent oxidoreductase [Phycisphaerales bacterium]